jgi:hypothetical protein
MTMTRHLRGQPLVALLAVLAGWMGGRISAWDIAMPIPAAKVHAKPLSGTYENRLEDRSEGDFMLGPLSFAGAGLYPPSGFVPGYPPASEVRSAYPVYVKVPVWVERQAPLKGAPPSMLYGDYRLAGSPEATAASSVTSGLGMAEEAGLPAGLPSLRQLAAQPYPSSSATPVSLPVVPPKRWSSDAWALVRKGSSGPLTNGALPATYGASQTGAVVRYRLVQGDPRQFSGYLRTTATLGAARGETTAALGLSGRPLPKVPIIAAVEAQLTQQGGTTRIQPAAMLVTQLPYIKMPGGLRGEAYAQAGYVAGRFATPFADGQFRADRKFLGQGRAELRLGGGVWGGAQDGAGRLDAGPSATLTMPLGRGAFGRVAADWRFRVAGDAYPGSGPALTLSAGF